MDNIQYDLEALSKKAYNGNPTPIIFELLKTSEHIDKLIQYLSGEEINDNCNKPDIVIRKEDFDRPCFKEWFSHAERL